MNENRGGARKGAGRPRSDDPLKRRTIALRESEWRQLEAIKEYNGLSLADTLRLMIAAWAT